MTYGLQPVPGKSFSLLVRNGRPLKNIRLRTLEFKPLTAQSWPPSWPPDGSGAPATHYFLQTTVTAVDDTGKKAFTLVSVVALEALTSARVGRYWQSNAASYKSF